MEDNYDQMICVNATLTIHVTLQKAQSHRLGELGVRNSFHKTTRIIKGTVVITIVF
jgi:hypothetical protein